MTTTKKNDRTGEKLVELLQTRSYSEPGPARWEFEKRRFMARLGEEAEGRQRIIQVSWSRRRAVPLFAGASALVGAAALLLIFLVRVPVSGQPVMVAGAWTLGHEDAIASGQPFEVEADSQAQLTLPDRTHLWLSEAAAGSFKEGKLDSFVLDSGHVVAKVTKQKDGRVFSITTPHASVRVLGTTFAVVVEGNQTRVRLHEGLVRVVYGADAVLVEPGHQVAVGIGGLKEMALIGNDEAVADLQLAGQRSWQGWLPEPLVELAAVEAIAVAPSAAQPEELDEKELAAVEPAKDSREKQIPSTKAQRTRRVVRAKKPMDLLKRVKGLYGEREFSKVVRLTNEKELPASVRLYRARSLEKLGRLDAAADLYTAVADGDSVEKPEATYLAAKLFYEMKQYGDSREYASRVSSVGGPMSEPAAFLAIRSLVAAGDFVEATLDCEDYMQLYPSGLHSEDVLFLSAFSRMQTGSTKVGVAELVNYLNRYPTGRYAEKARKLLGR